MPKEKFYGTSLVQSKFWGESAQIVLCPRNNRPSVGKSLEIIPLGTNHLKIGDDHYSWRVALCLAAEIPDK